MNTEQKIYFLRMELVRNDGSNIDQRIKSIIITKLEEVELWASKLGDSNLT